MGWSEGFKTGGSGFFCSFTVQCWWQLTNKTVVLSAFPLKPIRCRVRWDAVMVCKIINVPPGLDSADDKSPHMDVIQVTC